MEHDWAHIDAQKWTKFQNGTLRECLIFWLMDPGGS